MPLQRLDLKSMRYDELSGSVLVDGRNCVVEIAHDAIEYLAKKKFTPEEAVRAAARENVRLTRLASMLPPDDGKIHITTTHVRNDGRFSED